MRKVGEDRIAIIGIQVNQESVLLGEQAEWRGTLRSYPERSQ
jgi:hypothetical protein